MYLENTSLLRFFRLPSSIGGQPEKEKGPNRKKEKGKTRKRDFKKPTQAQRSGKGENKNAKNLLQFGMVLVGKKNWRRISG